MPIYILEFPGSDFTGYRGGVDFSHGKGSTSSKADADRLVSKFGCLIVEPEPASETKEAGAGPPAPAVIPEKSQGDSEPPVYANKADREQREKVEQIFGMDKKRKRGK